MKNIFYIIFILLLCSFSSLQFSEIKGEIEIEVGLGLPRMTTMQRLAYTPPNQGYKVFDTDKKLEFVYDGTNWISSNIKVAKLSNANGTQDFQTGGGALPNGNQMTFTIVKN